jgi:hypothetical protein
VVFSAQENAKLDFGRFNNMGRTRRNHGTEGFFFFSFASILFTTVKMIKNYLLCQWARPSGVCWSSKLKLQRPIKAHVMRQSGQVYHARFSSFH